VRADQGVLGWNTQLWLTIVVTAFTCAACAPNPGASPTPSLPSIEPSSTPSPSSQTSNGPLLTGTITISGTYAVAGTFTSHPQLAAGSSLTTPAANATCAGYADGFAQHPASFAVPMVQTTGERTVYLEASIASGYHGPGTYTNRSIPSLSGTVQVGIGGLEQGGFVDVFNSDAQSTSTLTVRPDGSGTLDFSGWSAGDTTVDGTVSWMCH